MKRQNLRGPIALLAGCFLSAAVHADTTNTVVNVTGTGESNVVSRIVRVRSEGARTNLITKTKFYEDGRLVEDRTEATGPTEVKATRVYVDGKLVSFEAWDSRSKLTTRTYYQDGRETVSEVCSNSAMAPDLVVVHGNGGEIVAALKRNESGELRRLKGEPLRELQAGAMVGTNFVNELMRKRELKKEPK